MKLQKGFLCFGRRFCVRIHLLLLPLLVSAYLGNYLSLFFISWCSAGLHELCHILAGKRLSVPVSGIVFMPFGLCAPLKEPFIKQPWKEILMALAGPLCNLGLAFGFEVTHTQVSSPLMVYGRDVNLAMAVLNLLPCLPLDGGRILRSILNLGTDTLSAYRITTSLSRIIAGGLFAIGIGCLVTTRFQFSVLMIGVFLLGNLFSEQKNISRQALEELLYHNKKLDRESLNACISLTAYSHLPARKLLRKLSFHRYSLVHVVDKHQRLLYTLTEDEILQALLNHSIRITLDEIYQTKNA